MCIVGAHPIQIGNRIDDRTDKTASCGASARCDPLHKACSKLVNKISSSNEMFLGYIDPKHSFMA